MKEKDKMVSYFENIPQPISTDDVYKSIKKKNIKIRFRAWTKS